jgi:hypothetical protein
VDLSGSHALSGSDAGVEFFENLAGGGDPGLRAHESHLVATGVHIDPELLLQDPESPVSLAVELRSHVVVVENEALSGAGLLLLGQKRVSQRISWRVS